MTICRAHELYISLLMLSCRLPLEVNEMPRPESRSLPGHYHVHTQSFHPARLQSGSTIRQALWPTVEVVMTGSSQTRRVNRANRCVIGGTRLMDVCEQGSRRADFDQQQVCTRLRLVYTPTPWKKLKPGSCLQKLHLHLFL